MNIRVGGLRFLIGHSAPRMAMACVWGGRVTVRLPSCHVRHWITAKTPFGWFYCTVDLAGATVNQRLSSCAIALYQLAFVERTSGAQSLVDRRKSR